MAIFHLERGDLEGQKLLVHIFTYLTSRKQRLSPTLLKNYFQILSTTISLLADISPLLPTAMFAFFALTSAVLSLFLPETHGQPLPETSEESEQVLQTVFSVILF